MVDLEPSANDGDPDTVTGGTHDHDTVAVDVDAFSGAALAGAIYHEFEHSSHARDAGTETDPTDGSVCDATNPTPDQLREAGQGIANHGNLYAEQLEKMCAIRDQGELPLDPKQCQQIKEGAMELIASNAQQLRSVSDQVDDAEEAGEITEESANEYRAAIGANIELYINVLDRVENACDC